VPTTSRQGALPDALHQAEFNPQFSGLRLFSTACSQSQSLTDRATASIQVDVSKVLPQQPGDDDP